MKVLAVAMVAVVCSAFLLGQADANVRVKNLSRTMNVSAYDATLNLLIENVGPNEVGRFSKISKLNQDLFKIVNLQTMQTITNQWMTLNTSVSVLDDGFGELSVLLEPEIVA